MLAPVRELTERRKRNLLRNHHGKNSLHEPGLKPSGPSYAGYARGGKYLADTSSGMGYAATAAALGMGAIALRRVSKVASIIVASAGLALLYRALRDILAPSDDMMEDDINFRNPNATLQHLEGEKLELAIIVGCGIDAAFHYCCEHPSLSVRREDASSDHEDHAFESTPTHEHHTIPIIEIFREQPGKVIAWRTEHSSKARAAGALRLREASDNTTFISLHVKYDPNGFTREAIESSFTALTDELERTKSHEPPQA
jgi:hypothetical protein